MLHFINFLDRLSHFEIHLWECKVYDPKSNFEIKEKIWYIEKKKKELKPEYICPYRGKSLRFDHVSVNKEDK